MQADLLSSAAIVDLTEHRPDRSLQSETRFQRRLKQVVDDALEQLFNNRSVSDLADAGSVTVRITLDEPSFEYDREKGNPRFVFVGNPQYNVGDKIPRPRGGGAGAGGGGTAGLGEKSEDDYTFELTNDDIEKRLFEHLRLPDMARKQLLMISDTTFVKGGLRTEGQAAMLSLGRTMRNAVARRHALRRPSDDDIDTLEDELTKLIAQGADTTHIETELAHMKRRREYVPFVDTRDRRYHRVNEEEERISQAVIFNLLDVSGSMSEHRKRLAKQFFWLLRRFLTSRPEYRHIDVVWLRHTDTAQEVDEKTFFTDRETGGTVVSSALEKMLKVVHERYPQHLWNFYCCQATDGDTGVTYQGEDDAVTSATIVLEHVLPMFQYYAYIECWERAPGGSKRSNETTTRLWEAYGQLVGARPNFQMKRVWEASQIYPVFANLFQDKAGVRRRSVG